MRAVGELEGLTAVQAAERVGVAAEAITPCGMMCAAFSIAGCANIHAQCTNPKNHNIALAENATYFTECPNAIALACGEALELHQCFQHCAAAGK